jgi:hypothetical protein
LSVPIYHIARVLASSMEIPMEAGGEGKAGRVKLTGAVLLRVN